MDTEPGGETARINTRGWVMQKRILSNRILHFGGKQVFWECNTTQACEAFPEGVQTWKEPCWYDEEFKQILSSSTHANRPWESSIPASMSEKGLRYADWAFLVDYYARLELTYGSVDGDKCVGAGVEGVAWNGEVYLAVCGREIYAASCGKWILRKPKRCVPYREPTDRSQRSQIR